MCGTCVIVSCMTLSHWQNWLYVVHVSCKALSLTLSKDWLLYWRPSLALHRVIFHSLRPPCGEIVITYSAFQEHAGSGSWWLWLPTCTVLSQEGEWVKVLCVEGVCMCAYAITHTGILGNVSVHAHASAHVVQAVQCGHWWSSSLYIQLTMRVCRCERCHYTHT